MEFHNLTFKADWIERINNLNAEQRSLTINAIYNYFVYGKLSDDVYVNFATSWIRDEIDRMKLALERRRKRREEKSKAEEEQTFVQPEPEFEEKAVPVDMAAPDNSSASLPSEDKSENAVVVINDEQDENAKEVPSKVSAKTTPVFPKQNMKNAPIRKSVPHKLRTPISFHDYNGKRNPSIERNLPAG